MLTGTPSRRSFKVSLKDKKNSLEFTVKNLKAKKSVQSDKITKTEFAINLIRALEVLNVSEVEPAANRDSDNECS